MTDDSSPYERRYPKIAPGHPRIGGIVEQLRQLRDATHPNLGEQSAKGKDFAAFAALQGANRLVELLAGWAIDHVAGLAAEGLDLVQLLPRGTTQHPEYLASRAAAD